ncbi:MAG: 2-phosphosulfolactate phosphatase [Anaerolineales bacterium]|nr:2-phosphosulfolactate phosphatase [Anaerolineales bacterium]
MHIDCIPPEACASATESVVVVDVWRSFTTAAYVFAAGAPEILITASAEEAFSLRARFPQAVLIGMGELGGEPATGFDYGNSPAEVREWDWHGHRIILCTPNGTPGLVRSVNARTLVAGSLVCARATVDYLKQQASERVAFVCTEEGIADQACAEYMTALLRNEHSETDVMLGTIRAAWLEHGRTLLARGVFTQAQWDKLEADLNCCLALDQFDFVMRVERLDGLLVMKAVTEPGSKHRTK